MLPWVFRGQGEAPPRRCRTPLSGQQEPSQLDRFASMVPRALNKKRELFTGVHRAVPRVVARLPEGSPMAWDRNVGRFAFHRLEEEVAEPPPTDALHRAGPSVQGRLTHVQLMATWKPSPLWSSQVSCEYCYYNQDLHWCALQPGSRQDLRRPHHALLLADGYVRPIGGVL